MINISLKEYLYKGWRHCNYAKYQKYFEVITKDRVNRVIKDDYCSNELMAILLENNAPLDKVNRQEHGDVLYFILPLNDPNWYQCDAYNRPTHGQILKWLREEYKILVIINPYFIYIYLTNIDTPRTGWRIETLKDDLSEYNSQYPYFEKYSDAVEFAIKHILQTLKSK